MGRPLLRRSLMATGLVMGALLAGCASPPKPPGSYVVLLPSPDGSVGRLVVESPDGARTLTEANTALTLAGSAPAFTVGKERLERDFGPAMGARPPLPEVFLIYFVLDSTDMVPESKALLPQILQAARSRATVDMSVIGHTDTLGKPQDNESLGLRRANAIAGQMRQLGIENMTLTVESHGERNLLVNTPDETSEPRNRRVEITLR